MTVAAGGSRATVTYDNGNAGRMREPASYAIVLDGDRIKFYLESGYIEDSLTFIPRSGE